MSLYAQKWDPIKEKWETVYAPDCDDSIKREILRCCSCLAPSRFALGQKKSNCFFSNEHRPDCPEAKNHKLIRINTHTQIDISAILNFVDGDVERRGGGVPPGGGAAGGGEEELPPDEALDYRLDPDATHTIRSARGMYYELLEKRGGSYIDDFSAREVDSIFLRRDTLHDLKKNWGCPEKLVVAKRCLPDKLEYKIPVPKGYVLLRDAYSTDDEDAIYFLVRMKHPEHDKIFKEKLFGKKPDEESSLSMGGKTKRVGKDPHKHIAIFAQWRRVKHSHYRVYRAELNSHMVAFINAPDA